MNKTPEKVLSDWIDNNRVKLEGATPAMLVAVMGGAVSAAYPSLIDAQLKMENLYAHAAARAVGEDVARELIAAEQRRARVSLDPFRWEHVKDEIDREAGIFG